MSQRIGPLLLLLTVGLGGCSDCPSGQGSPRQVRGRGPSPAVEPGGPPPMLDELVAQAEGGPCLWVYGRRNRPGTESQRYRNAAELCRIQALSEIADRGEGAAAATPSLLRLLPTVRDRDTGDGVMGVRSAALSALARVADAPAAVPVLVDAAATHLSPSTRRAAAARAVALGHDPAAELDRAAAVLRNGGARDDERLRALHRLVAFRDDRALAGLTLLLQDGELLDDVLEVAQDLASQGTPTWPVVRPACAALPPPPAGTPTAQADFDLRDRHRLCRAIEAQSTARDTGVPVLSPPSPASP